MMRGKENKASIGSNPSYLWRSIYASRPILLHGCRKRVGDGSTISIWRDPWLLDPNEPHIQTKIIDGLDQAVVADLIDGGKWNEALIRCLFNQRDVGLILEIPLPLSVYEDDWFWFLNKKGEYVVKEGYRVSLDMGFEEAGVIGVSWDRLWKIQVLAKVKFMVWRILRDVFTLQSQFVEKTC
ncbi:hypothetical protein GH714_011608 [Hevea brasiliensis]|uniref:Reverse transcriptase zinc-binding domain-containing protein n=1 Tax=Hevea brasiliensis TaxID=3981 RepID=A0A6A6M714_HEVBR|nr:hypothetical protein GH714_011608 [Hevea brasiliensis]